MSLHLDLWKNLSLIPWLTAIVCLGSCTNQPTDTQLEVWRKEAIARNAEILAENAKKAQQQEWNLVIQGETATGKSIKLDWQELQTLATTNVKTNDPNHIVQPSQVFDFRGIPVSTLLKKFGYQLSTTEVTFVCYDAYQVTLKLGDLLNYPIILAIASDGKPISREQGGPIYLVFPYTKYPQLQQIYDESKWSFYVSHMIIGTEAVKVRVGNRELNLADLDKLPQITLTQTVGYRVWWPSGKIKLHGVRVGDVLAAAGVKLSASGEVVVKGKASIYRSQTQPISLSAADVRDCDILLATSWGEDSQPILAKMGGPVTLAYGKDCPQKTQNQRWVTFVEELIVKQ